MFFPRWSAFCISFRIWRLVLRAFMNVFDGSDSISSEAHSGATWIRLWELRQERVVASGLGVQQFWDQAKEAVLEVVIQSFALNVSSLRCLAKLCWRCCCSFGKLWLTLIRDFQAFFKTSIKTWKRNNLPKWQHIKKRKETCCKVAEKHLIFLWSENYLGLPLWPSAVLGLWATGPEPLGGR